MDCSLAIVGSSATAFKQWCCNRGQINTLDPHAVPTSKVYSMVVGNKNKAGRPVANLINILRS